MNYYDLIFRRKSFHLFRNQKRISPFELKELKEYINLVKPLDLTIKTKIKVVKEDETSCNRGAEYVIEFYSEVKGNYLRNIGYMGEQIDLWLASRNMGSLWYGVGRPDEEKISDDLSFVIMMAIAKMPSESFRKDMFKAKRKPLNEVWSGDLIPSADIIRFAPSACNLQPWKVESSNGEIKVYRYKKPGKRGTMPSKKVRYYNMIDMGIFIFFLETCLSHDGYYYDSIQYYDDEPDSVEYTLVATYKIYRHETKDSKFMNDKI